jgi:sec-independent protein translocase protein TatB
MTTKLRGMAGDFQKQFNEALKEAELDEVKKSVDSLRGLNPTEQIKKHINPFEKAAADVRAGIQSAMAPKPSDAATPAVSATHVAEPLKNGATVMPDAAAVDGAASLQTPPPVLATPAPPPVVPGAQQAAQPVSGPSSVAAEPAKPVRKRAAPKAESKPAAAKSAVASAKPAASARPAARRSPGTASRTTRTPK